MTLPLHLFVNTFSGKSHNSFGIETARPVNCTAHLKIQIDIHTARFRVTEATAVNRVGEVHYGYERQEAEVKFAYW